MKYQPNRLGTNDWLFRNAVASVESVKKWIDLTSSIGYNTLMLYTEDTYEVSGEPYFGYMRGRYSREELRGLMLMLKTKIWNWSPVFRRLLIWTHWIDGRNIKNTLMWMIFCLLKTSEYIADWPYVCNPSRFVHFTGGAYWYGRGALTRAWTLCGLAWRGRTIRDYGPTSSSCLWYRRKIWLSLFDVVRYVFFGWHLAETTTSRKRSVTK